MLTPLPAALRKGVQEGFSVVEYSAFMRYVYALETGMLTVEEANSMVMGCLCPSTPNTGPDISVVAFALQDGRPDLYTRFVQWSAGQSVDTVCLDFLASDDIRSDLNYLDAVLALMLPTLEMRCVKFYGYTFDSLSDPSAFLKDLKLFMTEYNAPNMDTQEASRALQVFKNTQLQRQQRQGVTADVVLLPFAGDRQYAAGVTGHNAIMVCDLDLSFPRLMNKYLLLSSERLEISKLIFLCDVARSAHDAARQAGLRMCFATYKLEHHRTADENLRNTMQQLAGCSPTMQMALRAGMNCSASASSVGSVRTLWLSELQKRAKLTMLHPADNNFP